MVWSEIFLKKIKEHGEELSVYYNVQWHYLCFRNNLGTHRAIQPAIIYKNKSYFEWSWNGCVHRKDGPARIWSWKSPEYNIAAYHFKTREEFLKHQKEHLLYINGLPYLKDGRIIRDTEILDEWLYENQLKKLRIEYKDEFKTLFQNLSII